MPTTSSLAVLPQSIQQLLEQRQQHAQAIAAIDATLARVREALGTASTHRGRKLTTVSVKAPAARGKRRRRKFAVSANELVLAFVKAHKNPTTQEIKQHWASEGRSKGGTDNILSMLTKAKKLKRTPLGKGMRGSRYSLP
jgi:hypothetical protein